MEEIIEKIIKFILVLTFVIAGLLYWLLPKTKLAKHFKMNETLFVATNVIGIICGIIGLVVTLVWPQFIVEMHLWELILIPFVIIHVYWAIIMKTRKTLDVLDEKQEYDMTKAAAITWGLSIPAMVFLFILYDKEILSGIAWFPYYLFTALLIFSATTLFSFKKV